MSKKILFFLDSLRAGGRERRAVELFYFLKNKTDFEFQVVLVEDIVHYKYFYDLDIPIIKLKKRFLKKDPIPFFSFNSIVKEYKPDLIHTWSGMTTLYAIPSSKTYNIPIINGQIANAFPSISRSKFNNLLWSINRQFSALILANSNAGLKAYSAISKKGIVIHNGVNLERFQNLENKEILKFKFGIKTNYSIVMVASYNNYKDYDLFFKVANKVLEKRDDITFIGVGEGVKNSDFFRKNKEYNQIIFLDKISNVEELIKACDVGVLFSNIQTGEGFPNVVMEYMALSKPVIATDVGGTKELIEDGTSGFLVKNNEDQIVRIINNLIDNTELKEQMGDRGCEIIKQSFTIDRMGKKFVGVYNRF